MKKLKLLLILLLPMSVLAQEPTGYYSAAENKTTSTLKTALSSIMSANYVTKSYDYLYTIYETSDKTATGKVWDMYSTCTWDFGSGTCGNYSSVCDCYNREHSIPQSWFNSSSPMVSDAFHVYPTDGKVNGQRSNFPFGECANGTSLGANAKGKLGTSTFSGYSGTVFEPADEYKGDFARTYFYFATRYQNIMSSIGGDSFNNTTYPSLSDWSINLFLKWHRQDPVSQKEIDRNNAVYAHQKNRNAFIDHPELAEYVWGTKMGTNWTLNTTTDPTLSSPTSGSTLDFGTVSYQQNNTKTISVLGSSLTGDLTLALSGTNVTYFSIPVSTITKANAQAGYSLVITYNAPVIGSHNAVLTISGGGIATTTVNLKANAVGCQNLSYSAPFSTTISPFSQYSVSGDQVWTWKSAAFGVAMSGYASTTNNVNEDWLISPSIDLSSYEGVVLSFQHTINKGNVANMQAENSVWVSNNYTSGNPTAATWTQLTVPTYPAGNDWTFVNSGNVQIPSEKCKANTFIGFKYISTASASATWEIKELSITGTCKTTGIENLSKRFKHNVYTDNKTINISNLENEDITVFDIYGKKVAHQKNISGKTSISIYSSGIYVIKAGNETQKIIVK